MREQEHIHRRGHREHAGRGDYGKTGIDGNHRAQREHMLKVGHHKVGVVKANGEPRVGEDRSRLDLPTAKRMRMQA